MNVSDLLKELKPGEQLTVNKELKWVAVLHGKEDELKTSRVFKLKEDDTLEELPFEEVRTTLVDKIMSKIDTQQLVRLVLTEAIDTTRPEELFEMMSRLSKKKVKVRPGKGCVELCVGGKRGKPYRYRIM